MTDLKNTHTDTQTQTHTNTITVKDRRLEKQEQTFRVETREQRITATYQTDVRVKAHLDVFPVKLNPSGSHPQRKTPEEP